MTRIVLDAGHSYNTPGKRSPDGMREYAFNRAVCQAARKKLESQGIQTIMTHHDDRDIPLKERTNLANREKATLFISIHANAYGSGSWNDIHGIETYIHQENDPQSRSLAEAVHYSLIKETRRKDRGIKMADFHVLRETVMPAVLIECGFMTNREEKKLLASENYRILCGHTIAASILTFLGVKKTMYLVQTGAFSSIENAKKHAQDLKNAGFDAMITEK
ncbi:N-acetylmuramoyl-L-alanine amidase [Jeotgalibacillus sp. R-1-5s-1]|uniref:N-acetylmuramoyl-L-alanine amidase n=1 Tax=Jeotgalibacillus sp. R-1-5s-1 TaxID=2555897 RepID=UPI00106A7906|nr:N-acetylmuramoyl-L-alanine amidase [Jeotgalibacillus sp. R-1-5s-1]TFD95829.1 N-acetylmuramoyl-L-alanine amidase [Jeotgalibacillus sp. R-1-5s-1]